MSAHIHIGSCAWTYEDWKGSFYPVELPKSQWLPVYARTFDSVEINSTFYSTPTPAAVAHWLTETPARFRFVCKAPKAITHVRRLRDCGELLEDFLQVMEPLRSKLGAIVFQLPPNFGPEKNGPILREFILGLPRGWRFSIEFRHPDWHQPKFVKLLEDHNICWGWADLTPVAEQDQGPFGFLPETADFLYLRLMGDLKIKYRGGKMIHHYNQVQWPREKALESWAIRLRKQLDNVKTIYVACSNHYEGFSPSTCQTLARLLDLEVHPLPLAPKPVPPRSKGQLMLL